VVRPQYEDDLLADYKKPEDLISSGFNSPPLGAKAG